MCRAAANSVFRDPLQLVDGAAEGVFPFFRAEGAIQLDRGIAHIVPHRRHPGVRENRTFELQQFGLAIVLVEDIAEVSKPRF